MSGQKKGKKFMVNKRENEVKKKIQQPGEEKKEKDLIGPIIFKGTLNAVGFEQWYDQHLLPLLKKIPVDISKIKIKVKFQWQIIYTLSPNE